MPSITGPSLLCTSDTYTITNLPTGATVTGWSASPAGAVTLSGSGNSRTVTRVGSFNGQVTLTVTLATACGAVDIQRQLWVGSAQIHDILYPSSTVVPYQLIPLTIIPNPNSHANGYYKVEINRMGGGYSHTTYGNVIEFSLPMTGTYNVYVYADNACGWPTNFYPLVFECVAGGGMFSVYPNPASETLKVAVGSEAERNSVTDKSTLSTFTALLYDSTGRQLRQGESKDGKVEFDTRQLPAGTYFLHIHHNGEVEKRQVVIRH